MDWLELDRQAKAVGHEFAGGQPAHPAARRHLMKWMGAGMALAMAGLTKGSEAQTTAPAMSAAALPLGSWFLHVRFIAGPNAGASEATLGCFAPGGIMVESDAAGLQAHFGAWQPTPRGTFIYHLVEFNYDPTTQKLTQVVVPHIEFAMSGADQLQSVSTSVALYFYDPNGALVNTIQIPQVSQVTGQRITSTWVPPAQF